MNLVTKAFGKFVNYASLSEIEQSLVNKAIAAADNSYSPLSKYQVGAAILANNASGEEKVYDGCNSENDTIAVGICAESGVGAAAIAGGHTEFKVLALVASKDKPGGSPCGTCRQFIKQWSRNAELLLIADHDKNVRRGPVNALLPDPGSAPQSYGSLVGDEKNLVDSLLSHKPPAYVPYSKKPRKAAVLAANDEGSQKTFIGVETESAAFPCSITAVSAASSAAVSAGYARFSIVAYQGSSNIDGYSLQIIREFSAGATILFVREDKSIVRSNVDELLPYSFGPHSL